jgi:hypothetical protein
MWGADPVLASNLHNMEIHTQSGTTGTTALMDEPKQV